MSSGFCCAGNKILQFVICRAKLHAAALPMGKFLYVKTEFCQKSRPVFLRFFALTFHNFRRRSRRNAPLSGKTQPGFQKELSTFPTDFSTSIFLCISVLIRRISRKCQSANGILFVSGCRYAVSITNCPRHMQENARHCKTGGGRSPPPVSNLKQHLCDLSHKSALAHGDVVVPATMMWSESSTPSRSSARANRAMGESSSTEGAHAVAGGCAARMTALTRYCSASSASLRAFTSAASTVPRLYSRAADGRFRASSSSADGLPPSRT